MNTIVSILFLFYMVVGLNGASESRFLIREKKELHGSYALSRMDSVLGHFVEQQNVFRRNHGRDLKEYEVLEGMLMSQSGVATV